MATITQQAILSEYVFDKEEVKTPGWSVPSVFVWSLSSQLEEMLRRFLNKYPADELPNDLFLSHVAALFVCDEDGNRILLKKDGDEYSFDAEVIKKLREGPEPPLAAIQKVAMAMRDKRFERLEGNSPQGQTSG